jgi:hypothetical protein
MRKMKYLASILQRSSIIVTYKQKTIKVTLQIKMLYLNGLKIHFIIKLKREYMKK